MRRNHGLTVVISEGVHGGGGKVLACGGGVRRWPASWRRARHHNAFLDMILHLPRRHPGPFRFLHFMRVYIVAPPPYARPPYASSVLDLPLVFAAKLLQSSFAAYALEVGYDLRSL